MPALILVNSDGETISMGTSSIFGASSGRPAGNTTKIQSRIARCNAMEMAALLRTSCPLLRLLLYIGDERDPAKARGADRSHHPHHDAVVHSSVAAHENALVVSILCDSSELRRDLIDLELGVLQEDASLWIDRNRQRLLGTFELLRFGFRKLDRHTDGKQRRRHHEEDQENKHDVDHRRHIDLAHRPRRATAAATAVA